MTHDEELTLTHLYTQTLYPSSTFFFVVAHFKIYYLFKSKSFFTLENNLHERVSYSVFQTQSPRNRNRQGKALSQCALCKRFILTLLSNMLLLYTHRDEKVYTKIEHTITMSFFLQHQMFQGPFHNFSSLTLLPLSCYAILSGNHPLLVHSTRPNFRSNHILFHPIFLSVYLIPIELLLLDTLRHLGKQNNNGHPKIPTQCVTTRILTAIFGQPKLLCPSNRKLLSVFLTLL